MILHLMDEYTDIASIYSLYQLKKYAPRIRRNSKTNFRS